MFVHNRLPWSRSSDRLPPGPTAGSKTLPVALLRGLLPRLSWSVNRKKTQWDKTPPRQILWRGNQKHSSSPDKQHLHRQKRMFSMRLTRPLPWEQHVSFGPNLFNFSKNQLNKQCRWSTAGQQFVHSAEGETAGTHSVWHVKCFWCSVVILLNSVALKWAEWASFLEGALVCRCWFSNKIWKSNPRLTKLCEPLTPIQGTCEAGNECCLSWMSLNGLSAVT